jgi:hypothetical protein
MGQVIDPNSLLIKTDRQPATVAFLNNLIKQFCFAINGIGTRMDGYDVAEQNLINLGLANINSVLGPFLGTLQQAAALGFLVGEADGQTNSLVVGQQFDMALTNDGAELFTPTHYLTMLDVNDYTNWGICQLISWVQQDANLSTLCVYATKTKTSNSWQVACNSGTLMACINAMNAASSSASTAASDLAAMQALVGPLNALAAAISAGPVSSVAGKTGAVTLVENDIGGLVADLSNRPTIAAMNSATSGLQPHSATLDALAALTYSSFIIAFLGAANAGAAMTTLGAAPLASPTFTGTPKAPTPAPGDNTTNIATTAFLAAALSAALPSYAPLASPALTGTPTAPTPTVGDNTTKLATTAFVLANAPIGKGPVRTANSGNIAVGSADIGGVVVMNFSGINAAPQFTLPATSTSVPVGSWVRLMVLNPGTSDGTTPNYNAVVVGATGAVTVWNGSVSGSTLSAQPGIGQTFVMYASNSWNAIY